MIEFGLALALLALRVRSRWLTSGVAALGLALAGAGAWGPGIESAEVAQPPPALAAHSTAIDGPRRVD